jgi:hypothetical protein
MLSFCSLMLTRVEDFTSSSGIPFSVHARARGKTMLTRQTKLPRPPEREFEELGDGTLEGA